MVSHLLHDKPSLPPSKLPLPMEGDLDLHLIPGSFGPSESSTQTASRTIQAVQPFLQGSQLRQTDRQTDRPRCISNNSPHRHVGLRSNAMRPHNITTVYAFRQNRPLTVQSCVCSECATGSKKHDNDVCRTTAVDSFPRGSRPIIGSSLSTVFFDREVNCELSTS